MRECVVPLLLSMLMLACGFDLASDEAIERSYSEHADSFTRAAKLFSEYGSLVRIEVTDGECVGVDFTPPEAMLESLRQARVMYVYRRFSQPSEVVFVISCDGAVTSSACKGIAYSPQRPISYDRDGTSIHYRPLSGNWYVFEQME